MSNQFTPGPWEVSKTYQGALTDRFAGFPFAVQGADGFQPALIYGDGKLNAGTAEANARLIAAAPALYEALKQSSEIIEALLLGTITKEQRYSETARASKNMAAALALVD